MVTLNNFPEAFYKSVFHNTCNTTHFKQSIMYTSGYIDLQADVFAMPAKVRPCCYTSMLLCVLRNWKLLCLASGFCFSMSPSVLPVFK